MSPHTAPRLPGRSKRTRPSDRFSPSRRPCVANRRRGARSSADRRERTQNRYDRLHRPRPHRFRQALQLQRAGQSNASRNFAPRVPSSQSPARRAKQGSEPPPHFRRKTDTTHGTQPWDPRRWRPDHSAPKHRPPKHFATFAPRPHTRCVLPFGSTIAPAVLPRSNMRHVRHARIVEMVRRICRMAGRGLGFSDKARCGAQPRSRVA